jgi:hypothetical protein
MPLRRLKWPLCGSGYVLHDARILHRRRFLFSCGRPHHSISGSRALPDEMSEFPSTSEVTAPVEVPVDRGVSLDRLHNSFGACFP